MPDETDLLEIEEQTLIVPGVLCVSPTASGKKRIRIGPSAGWMLPRGIMKWERELSFVRRSDATADFLAALRGTLPHEQIAPKKHAMAYQAAMASPLIPLASSLVVEARGQGVRVYTVGVDRVSAGFYYFAEGGAAEPVRWQGNLVEMLAPGLKANATNAEIEALLEGLIERLLLTFSDGSFSELDVELADAMPRLARDGTGMQGTNLDAFDASTRRLALQSGPWEGPARKLAEAVAGAGSASDTLRVPLYGEARREVRAALDVHFGGKTLRLADQPLWFVTGQPKEEAPAVVVPAAKPAPAPAATPAVAGAASPARPATASTATLAGVAAPVTSGAPLPAPAVVPIAPAVIPAAGRPAVAASAASPTAISSRLSPPTPAVAMTPSPVVSAAPQASAAESPSASAPEATAPAASARAKTEVVEAPPAPAPAPATLAGPASELPAPEPPAPEAAAPVPAPAAAASTEAPAVAEPPAAEAASTEPATSEAIVPAGDERVVPAKRDEKALAKRRPFPFSTLLLIFALAYFVLRRFHVIP